MTPSSGAICQRLDQIGDLCDRPVSGRVFLHFRYIRVACVIYLKNLVGYISTKSDKTARKVKEKYQAHLKTSMTPRFSVQYKSPSHHGSTTYLYILPLKQEDEIQFHEGRFISAEDINKHPKQYTSNLQMEGELLGMAAELWNDFYL